MHVPLTPIRALYPAVDLYAKKTGVVAGGHRFTYAEFGERETFWNGKETRIHS